MELFRTPITIEALGLLGQGHSFVSLGSCFADSIGQKLLAFKWSGLANPFGTLFHPFALFQLLDPQSILDPDLFLEREGHVFHYHLPKTFFARDRSSFLQRWEDLKKSLFAELDRPHSTLFLTFGTSVLYSMGGAWVANCHQQPARLFQKSMTSVEDMAAAWMRALDHLPKHCTVIVTVSPVRHQKEGLVQSSLSKSQLRLLAETMRASAPDRVHYFPAFEIMMDELRDYRFYARDMLHPSDEAIDYIWDRFSEGFLTPEAQMFCRQWSKILRKLEHRPLHPRSESYRTFLSQLLKELDYFSDLSLVDEKESVITKLRAIDSTPISE